MTSINEDTVEQAALGWLKDLGYAYCYGPDIAPDGTAPERSTNADVVLEARLRDALLRLNPKANPRHSKTPLVRFCSSKART